MRVVQIAKFGPPEVLVPTDADDLQPGPGQVLVEVEVAGVNLVDVRVRAGAMPPPGGLEPPYVPGNEVGGVIREVGAGVSAALLGRRVITGVGGSGGYAERVAVDAAGVVEVPDDVGLRKATALFVQGRVAVGALRAAGLSGGERVMILAAAGGVGSLLLQLTRHAGAGSVIGAGHGESDLRLMEQLSADAAVDYERADFGERLRAATGGAGPDVVFDGVGRRYSSPEVPNEPADRPEPGRAGG